MRGGRQRYPKRISPEVTVSLIIFDCDGVLVDSEPLAMRVLLETIAAEGVEIDPDIAFRDFLGRSLKSIIANLNAAYGLNLTDAALARMRANLYAAYARDLKPMAGLIDALAEIRVPVCVASSSQMERIRVSLSVTGLIDRFEPAIFSASMVERGKPAPDLFLHAARSMGADPAECLVIEDSPAGIIAAKAAGMRVFAFLGGGHIGPSGLRAEIESLNPTIAFDDMHALPRLVEEAAARENVGMGDLLAAVDVGTGSARAGVFTATGRLLGRAEHPIALRRRSANEAEHDSEDIWAAATEAVRGAVAASGAKPDDIAAIAFDATCSLVVRGKHGEQVAVAPDGETRWDTIIWFDHRATAEAAECTATGDPVLQHLGGVMSPEMQLPKLMWLKRHLPASWAAMGAAFDLADFLAFRAIGSNARSQSTLACKWQWGAGGPGWPRGFFDKIGLDDLIERGSLPEAATPPGTDLGPLTATAAAQLGLTTRTRVAAGLIDAHAGALCVLGAHASEPAKLDRYLCLVAGTSNSVLALAPDARPIAGVWGPAEGAILPGLWLLEAGQSASGALLDHVIRSHPAGGTPDAARHKAIAERIAVLRGTEGVAFGARLHVLPDFRGNRSPRAEPSALGVISGLALDTDFDSLCRLYWRTALALALGIRQNLDVLRAAGFDADRLLLAGGHARNDLLVGLYADATGLTVIEPNAPDVVLLGGAMLAATAAALYPALIGAAAAMDQGGAERAPDATSRASFDRDYRIFLEMQRQRRVIEGM